MFFDRVEKQGKRVKLTQLELEDDLNRSSRSTGYRWAGNRVRRGSSRSLVNGLGIWACASGLMSWACGLVRLGL